jgi:AraC-like DNA-binding protein
MSATFLASVSNIFCRILKLHGHDPALLFKVVGMDFEKGRIPGSRLNFELNNLLFKKAVDLLDDPFVGLEAAQCWHPSDFNALGYAWLTSSSLRTALQRLCRYSKMVSDGVDMSMMDTADGLSLIINYREFVEEIPARNDANMAIVMDMCRINYGTPLDPVKITFMHDKPSCMKRYENYFRCPVLFNCPEDSLTLPRLEADQRLSSSNPYLASLNDQIIIAYLADLDSSNIPEQVQKSIIKQLPSGSVSKIKIAKDLGMSVRSMQRKLQNSGTSYQELLEQTREDLAIKYIEGTKNSMTEIAFLLGFSESSAFSRAFRRWVGVSPLTLRSQH